MCHIQAFMFFINENPAAAQPSRSAELLAKYTDKALKRAGRALQTLDVDVAISKAVRLSRSVIEPMPDFMTCRSQFSATCKTKTSFRSFTSSFLRAV